MTGAPARRVAALVTAIVSFVVVGQLVNGGVAVSQSAESFRDEFASISYSGNDGSLAWSGPWREIAESDGPTTGLVQVVASDRCSGGSGNCLRIGVEGGDLANHGASREADLTGATSATLSFQYRRQFQGKPLGTASIQVSGNGGSSWATLGTIDLAGPQNAASASFDMSSHVGARTIVRMRVSGGALSGYLYVDTVIVSAAMPSPTTTTAPMTTTTAPTTTTTAPTTSTTSTIPPPTSTMPGSSSTTSSTIAGSSTTSTPLGSGTSTTSVAGATPTTTTEGGTGAATNGGSPGASSNPPAAEGGSTSGSSEAGPSEPGSLGGDGSAPTEAGQTVAGGSADGRPVDGAGSDPSGDPTTLMAIATDAAVDAAVPGIVLALVVAALALIGVVPRVSAPPPDRTPSPVEGDGGPPGEAP
jgi:hypothetical protein